MSECPCQRLASFATHQIYEAAFSHDLVPMLTEAKEKRESELDDDDDDSDDDEENDDTTTTLHRYLRN